MSAICGIVHFDGAPVDPELLRSMADSSAIRGPNGVRFHVGAGAGFAHLAFHVTPESVRERQPLKSDDGRLVLVADVRLDNRSELIPRLTGAHPGDAPTLTDADLLLLAYQTWGGRCVEHLLGDFVFAVWNEPARELFLARDPLGGYSVSYFQTGNRFVFASETAAILDLPGFNPTLNELTVTRTLAGLSPTAEDTFFESVFYLPPAYCLTVSPAGSRQRRYWDIAPQARIDYHDDGQYVDHFLAILNQAVACRLRSIGPVGISLSGGNDSTLLAACAARLLPAANPAHPRLRSFSYVFDRHPECDERGYIEPVVARYDLDATWIDGDEHWTFRDLSMQPIARDFLWTNCYVQLPMAVAWAAQGAGCRVLLDGHFGDTLCSGHSYYAADLLSRGDWRRLLALLRTERRAADRWRALARHGLRPLVPEWLRRVYRRLNLLPLKPFVAGLAPDRLQRLETAYRRETRSVVCERLGAGRRPRCRSLLNPSWPTGMAAVRGFLYARHGLEKTSPYFDRRLVEFILAIPQEQIARPGEPRRLQRAAMRRLLPPVVWQRESKTRYESLLREGLFEKERATLTALLTHSRVTRNRWIESAWLQSRLAAATLDDDAMYVLSMCAHLELWLTAVAEASGATIGWATPFYQTPGDAQAKLARASTTPGAGN